MDVKRIGLFLKELRKEKQITQEELAEKLGVSNRTVSRWETGSNMPDFDVLIELSDFYDVEIRDRTLDFFRKIFTLQILILEFFGKLFEDFWKILYEHCGNTKNL